MEQYYYVQEITHYCNISAKHCSAIKKNAFPFWELTLVLSGSMTYIVDGVSHTLKKDDAVLVPCDVERERLRDAAPVKYVSFNFHLLPDTTLDLPVHIAGGVSADIRRLLSAFPQSHLSPYYHAHEKVANMLNYILFELQDNVCMPSNNEHILNITKYIGEHITEPLTLASISRTVGLSREYVSYLFKREMNTTLTDFIHSQKMLLAKQLVLNREMELTAIAQYLGYENYSYFSRLFKHYFDISPRRMQ